MAQREKLAYSVDPAEPDVIYITRKRLKATHIEQDQLRHHGIDFDDSSKEWRANKHKWVLNDLWYYTDPQINKCLWHFINSQRNKVPVVIPEHRARCGALLPNGQAYCSELMILPDDFVGTVDDADRSGFCNQHIIHAEKCMAQIDEHTHQAAIRAGAPKFLSERDFEYDANGLMIPKQQA